ncbi:MAG: hypothetical protein AAF519_20885 [Bacteroidota bacterium]
MVAFILLKLFNILSGYNDKEVPIAEMIEATRIGDRFINSNLMPLR